MQVTIHEAKTHLSRLIKKVLAGEEVIIVKRDRPVAKLIAFDNSQTERTIGADQGKIWIADDFEAPLEDFQEYM